jgi:hypothetical protein
MVQKDLNCHMDPTFHIHAKIRGKISAFGDQNKKTWNVMIGIRQRGFKNERPQFNIKFKIHGSMFCTRRRSFSLIACHPKTEYTQSLPYIA